MDKGAISIKNGGVKISGAKTQMDNATVTSVSIVNNQLIISGSDLKYATSVKVKGASFLEEFSIESISNNQIVANGLKNISFKIGQVFDLVISDTYGAATFTITFELQDGAVSAAKIVDGAIGANHLSDMGAGTGQVMQWNGSTWVPTDLSGLVYLGSWDATQVGVGPDAGAASVAGEYYVVSNPGTVDVDGINIWAAGDWVVWNGTNWDKIDNSTGVTSFNGRVGPITPTTGDYDLSELGDVDTTGISAGKILKYDGSKWIISDDLSSGGAGSVSSSEIQDGTITNADINATAGIDQSKILGLSTSLASKLDLTGGVMSGALDMGTNNIGNVGTVNGVDITSLNTQVGTNTSNISTNAGDILSLQTSVSTNSSSISANTSAITTKFNVADVDTDITLAADSDSKVASQKAIKSYVDSAVSGVGASDFVKKDGSIAMTGALDASTFGLKFKDGDTNYVTLKANVAMASDLSLTFPANNGSNGQVLSTDGAGNLSWIAPTTGSVTNVAVTAPLQSSGGATPNLSISQSSGSTNGFLSSTDWNTFNNKVSATRTINSKPLSADVTLITTDIAEGTNLYFTDVRAKSAAVVNSTAGTQTDQAPSVAAIKTYVDSADATKVDKTTTVNGKSLSSNVTLLTTDVAEGTNQYFTNTRAKAATVVNSTAGSETDQAPSVNAIKTYVTNAIDANGKWLKNASDIYYNSGNIGVGTLAPAAKLEVQGATDPVAIRLTETTGDDSIWEFRAYNVGLGVNDNQFSIWGGVATGTLADRLVIGKTGNVGIGSLNPLYQLHVQNTTGASSIAVDANSANTPSFKLLKDSTLKWNIYTGATDALHFYNGTSNIVTFSNIAPTNSLFLSDAGKVGIGTSSPRDKLTVFDTSVATLTITGDSDLDVANLNLFELGTSGSESGFQLQFNGDNTSNSLLLNSYIAGASTTVMKINRDNGYVGIGSATASQKLDVDNGHIETSPGYGIGHAFGTASEHTIYPYTTGINAMGGYGATAPYDNGTLLKSDEAIIMAETDNNEVVGYFDVNAKKMMWNGGLVLGGTTTQERININDNLFIHNGGDDVIGFRYIPALAKTSSTVANIYPSELRHSPVAGTFSIGIDSTPRSTGDTGTINKILTVTKDQRVGINTLSPAHALHVIGSAGLSTGTAWTNTSDIRLKDIQGDYEYGLSEIEKLHTVRFNYKDGNALGLPSDKNIIGFIAQEVQQVIPEAVVEREDGYLELNVDPIHWAAINAIQELNQKLKDNANKFDMMRTGIVEENSRKIASLELENEAMKAELKALKEQNLKMQDQLNSIEEKMKMILEKSVP